MAKYIVLLDDARSCEREFLRCKHEAPYLIAGGFEDQSIQYEYTCLGCMTEEERDLITSDRCISQHKFEAEWLTSEVTIFHDKVTAAFVGGQLIGPDQFARKMKSIKKLDDEDTRHRLGDTLMVSLLASLGYQSGVQAFSAMQKYYS